MQKDHIKIVNILWYYKKNSKSHISKVYDHHNNNDKKYDNNIFFYFISDLPNFDIVKSQGEATFFYFFH